MFELARRFIKTGFAFFLTGLAMGLYMIVRKHIFGKWPEPSLITAHVHVLLVGFMLSLIMGIAIWMFPKDRKEKSYSGRLAEITYWLLTLGTLMRFAAEVSLAYTGGGMILGYFAVLGGLFQFLAGLTFVINMWGRVKPMGKQA